MSDLKPCPFCGGEASHNGGGDSVFGRFWWTVGCKTCDFWLSDKEVWSQTDHGMLDPAYPPKHCFALWNKRAAVNHREEVMPDDARTSRPAHDIGPGDQGKVSGAALVGMVTKFSYEPGPEWCRLDGRRLPAYQYPELAKAVGPWCRDGVITLPDLRDHDVPPYRHYVRAAGAAPVVYSFDGMSADDLRRQLEFEDRPPFDRRDAILKALDALQTADMTNGGIWDAILYGMGLLKDGKHVPVREFYAGLEGLFRLKGDTLGLRCATTGCGQHVSVRLERDGVGSDYCEPCGLKAVRA